MTSPQELQAFMQTIWSPYCKGVSLLECPSSKAEALRTEIRQRIEKGESIESIKSDLQGRYETSLRMAPLEGGRENLAYIVPWVVFSALSLLVIVVWLGRRVRPKTASPSPTAHVDPEIARRIEEDLKERS